MEKPWKSARDFYDPFMLIAAKNFRRLLSCLALLASLTGSLQQCHAFCYLTECKTASNDAEVCDCGDCCCGEHTCHQHEAASSDSGDAGLIDQESMPSESGCWFCRPGEPVVTSTDATEEAKKLAASSGWLAVEAVANSLSRQVVFAAFRSTKQDSTSLSAAEFCVQLCRFRI